MKILFYVSILLLLFACNNENETKQNQETRQQQTTKIFEPNPELEEERVPVSKPEVITFDESFLPEGYKIITYGDSISNVIRGNLNGNEAEDVAVFAVLDYNGGAYDEYKDARIFIFEDDGEGTFELKSESGNLIDYVNPYESNQLELRKNVIMISHQGMRWHREMKFRYESKYEDFMLIGSEDFYYGGATHDGSGRTSTNYLTGVRIENLNEFDYEKEELNPLPAKQTKVSKNLISIREINSDNFYDY